MRLAPDSDGIQSLLPAGAGMSSATPGVLLAGERVVMPDDNVTPSPTVPVLAYNVPNPRVASYHHYQTGHINQWGSSDVGANVGSNANNSDDQHPMVCTYETGTTATGHICLQAAGGNLLNIFSTTSHLRIYDCVFMVPVLSNGTQAFNVRLGWSAVVAGATTNGAYLEFDSNVSGVASFVTADTSVRTTTSTGVTIVAGTWYRLRIVATNATQIDCYLITENTALPGTPTVTNTTNIPVGTTKGSQPVAMIEKNIGTTTSELSMLYVVTGIDKLAA